MVSPKGQDNKIGLCLARNGEIRRTATDREQRDPQTSGPQTPERHILRVEGDKSVVVGVVGGHCLFAMRL